MFHFSLFQQSMHDRIGVQTLQVGVRLSRAHENNRLTGDVGHGDGGTDLRKSYHWIIRFICKQNSINN